MKKIITQVFTIIVVAVFGVATACAATPEAGKVNSISASEFVKYIGSYDNGVKALKYKGTRPAVVDFYATWCGPCRALAPTMVELAKEYKGKVDFYKVDVDNAQALAQKFNITSIPTILFVPVGKEPIAIMGAYPKEDIVKTMNYVFK